MPSLFSDFADVITTNEDGRSSLGIAELPAMPISGFRTTTINPDEQGRPDKVSQRLYETPLLSWVIDEANGFDGHFRNYRPGLEIRYIPLERLRQIGVSTDG